MIQRDTVPGARAGALIWGILAGLLLAGGPPIDAQTTAAPSPLKFEVAALKASPPQADDRGGVRPAPGGERYVASNCPLKLLITVAYQVKGDHVTGGPDWIATDRFDMNAKAPKPSTIDE